MEEVTAEIIERGHGPDTQKSAQRRRDSAKMREVREKLTSSSDRQTFDLDLLRIFADSRRGSTLTLAVLALATATLCSLWTSPAEALSWLALAATALSLMAVITHVFLRQSSAGQKSRRWRPAFIIMEGVQGIVWASSVLLVAPFHSAAAQTFVLFILLLVGALTAMISAPLPMGVYAGLVR